MMKFDKEKMKKKGSHLVCSAKETVKFAAPAVASIPVHLSGHTEIAQPMVKYGTIPWAIGYTGYSIYKNRKKVKRKVK